MLTPRWPSLQANVRAANRFFLIARNDPLYLRWSPRRFSPWRPRRSSNRTQASELAVAETRHRYSTSSNAQSLPSDVSPPPLTADTFLPFYGNGYIDHLNRHFKQLRRLGSKDEWADVPADKRPGRYERAKQTAWCDMIQKDDESEERLVDLSRIYPWAFAASRFNLPLNYKEGERLNSAKRAESLFLDSREETVKELSRCLQIVDLLLDYNRLARKRPETFNTGKVIYVSESVIVELFGHEFENKLGLDVGTGCHVTVVNKMESDAQGRRKVVLKGSPRAIELAERQIQAASEVDQHSPFPRRNQGSNSIVRPVWANIRDIKSTVRTMKVQRRPVDVPRPSEWNVKTLANYIDDLVRCELPESKMRLYYDDESAFYEETADIILNLLSDPGVHKFVSSKVVRTVISFFVHHQNLTSLNRLLPMFDGLMTTRAFNELLRAASRRSDLFLFMNYISLMMHAGVVPNGWEWVHFLKGIQSSKIRSYMLLHLKQLGVLQPPHILKAAVASSLQDSFAFHVSTGKDVFAYLEGLERVFGNWISSQAINNLILEAGWMRSPEAMAAILEYCRRKDIPLDNMSLIYGLLYFVDTKRFKAGIEFFLDMVQTRRVRRTDVSMQLLFVLAWKRRAYNVTRLIWRYCCLEGSVSEAMQEMVSRSLIRNTPVEPKNQGDIWRKTIGKVVVGVENDLVLSGVDPANPDHLLEPQFAVENPKLPPKIFPANSSRPEQVQCAKQLLDKDLESCEKYEAFMAFEDMLWPAMQRDLEWGPHARQRGPEWLAENAIRVPVAVARKVRMVETNTSQEAVKAFDPYYTEDAEDEKASSAKEVETATEPEQQPPAREEGPDQKPSAPGRSADSQGPSSPGKSDPQWRVRYLKPDRRPATMDYISR
ncbi:hypothetical protein VTO42DRAFT_3202 [Malbranchea cinnamomea]